MNNFIKHINQYTALLKEASVWHNSKEILAPIITEKNTELASDNYIYEFYCYISIIVDLQANYEIKFVPGKGDYKYKFPQAAAPKAGKPKFLAYNNNELQFQICAGTKIKSAFASEENHPDISFQAANASDDPTLDDLILIMDAKFKERFDSLPKTEVYKFGFIIGLFKLNAKPKLIVRFKKYVGFEANCLITNGKSYSDNSDVELLKYHFIKEVESFYPAAKFKIVG